MNSAALQKLVTEDIPAELRLLQLIAIVDSSKLRVEEITRLLNEENLDEQAIIEGIRFHKVYPQVDANICQLKKEYGIASSIFSNIQAKIYNTWQTDRRVHEQGIGKILAAILNVDSDALFIKGATFQAAYLKYTNSFRALSDVDVVLSAPCKCFDLLINSVQEGYRIEPESFVRLGTKISPANSNIFGETDVSEVHVHVEYVGAIGNWVPDLDIKYSDNIFIPVSILKSHQTRFRFNTVEFNGVSLEDSVYIIVKHIAEHGYIKLHWINDFYVLCKHFKLDWEYVNTLLKDRGLQSVFESIKKYAEEMYAVALDTDPILPSRPSAFSFLLFNQKQSLFVAHMIEWEAVMNRKRTPAISILFSILLFFKYWYMALTRKWLTQIRRIRQGRLGRNKILRYFLSPPKRYTSFSLSELGGVNAKLALRFDRESGYYMEYKTLRITL